MARILVLDGHSAAALSFTRSLGRAGHWIAVGANEGISAPATLSRYCRVNFRHPISTEDAPAFLGTLLHFARRHAIDLILPMTDWTILPLSKHRDCFRGAARLALGPHAGLEASSDKFETISMARELQLPVPSTTLLRSVADLDDFESKSYPVVLKDRFSTRWVGDHAIFGSVEYAFSQQDLRRKVQARLGTVNDVLVQEFISGAGVGFSALGIDNNLYLPFEWLRVREVDPRGSGSSARRSIALDTDILEYSRMLIRRIGFQGICMVEFKRTECGRAVLMELNGRPWGSIQLPIASGIDYPSYLVDWYLEGKSPVDEVKYKEGIVCRRLVSELRHLENVLRGTPAGWPIPYPRFLPTLLKVCVPWFPGMRYDDIWLSDPRPGLAGLGHWCWAHAKGAKAKLAGRPAKVQ